MRRQCDIRKQCNQMMALLKARFGKKKKKKLNKSLELDSVRVRELHLI